MTTITFDETYKKSRKLKFSKDNVSQTIVGVLCGDFYGEGGPGENGLYSDDLVVLQAVYDYFPITYELPTRSGGSVLLAQSTIDLEQISDDTWEATVVYDVPEDGDSQPPQSGPAASEPQENKTENFTQISVNLSPISRNVKKSFQVTSCSKNVNLPYVSGPCPYTVGSPAPIGHTENGVEGTEVYAKEFGFNITVYMPPQKLTYQYVRKLSRMYLTLNLETFFGFPPGSVLFTGLNFSGDLYQVIPVSFEFQVANNFKFSRTEPTLTPRPDADPDDYYEIYNEPEFEDTDVLSGWDVVDYRYGPATSVDDKMMIQEPVLRLTQQVYLYTNFGAFEI